MRDIITEALRLAQSNQPFVIATVVRTKGSTPQKAGAKLLIRSDGSALGTLGGGCVEGEMWHLGTKLLREKGRALYREYELNEELSDQGGLVCGGTMSFFIEPFLTPVKNIGLFERSTQALENDEPVAIMTIIDGSEKPTKNCKKLILDNLHASNRQAELTDDMVKIVTTILKNGGQKLLEEESDRKVYIEAYTAPPALLLIGAGHVNKCVADLAVPLGYRVQIVDDRQEFANHDRFPEADAVFVREYETGLKDIAVTANTAVVIATRGHHCDDVALALALQTPASYIGLVGSKRKTALIFRNLRQNGIADDRLAQIHAPIGLDIGAVTPEELAVSIMAEITMLRRNGTGKPMTMALSMKESSRKTQGTR